MPDNPKIRHPKDGKRINLKQSYEVAFWCEKFGCTKEQLEAAVKAVGIFADDVEAEIQRIKARLRASQQRDSGRER